MLENQILEKLTDALYIEYKTDQPLKILSTIPPPWLQEHFPEAAKMSVSQLTASDWRHQIIKVWSAFKAKELLESVCKNAADYLFNIAVKKTVPDDTAKEIESLKMEREMQQGLINGLQTQVNELKAKLSRNYDLERDVAKLSTNLTNAIFLIEGETRRAKNEENDLNSQAEDLREYVRNIQRKLWPNGVPDSYRLKREQQGPRIKKAITKAARKTTRK